jgi:cytochrome c551/c552
MPATDHFRWNQQKLHAVFAASSVVLLLAVYAMLRQDQADEWRGVQRNVFTIDAAIRQRELQRVRSPEYLKRLDEVESQLKEATETAQQQKESKAELFRKLDEQTRLVESLEVDLKFRNSNRDEAAANLDLAVRDGLSEAVMSARKSEYDFRKQQCDERAKELDAARDALASLAAEAKSVTMAVDELEASRTTLVAESDRITALLENIAPTDKASAFKRALMELPIIDGFNSHLRVVQDWLPKLKITLGMSKIARFDRCRSCHQNIDKIAGSGAPAYPPGHPESDDVLQWVKANQYPQPYSTHPNTALYCTASSPHPVATFGCTICHDGQGSGTSFGNAEHTPNDPHIADEWHHEYGFHPNHFWEYPMQPDRFIESSCIKCHHNVTELGINPKFGASAPKVYRGDQLLRKYGCYGCHEIHGYDAGVPIGPDRRLEPQTEAELAKIAADPTQVAGKLRKVGPSLRHISSKTSSEFIQYWTEIPGRYRPSTKMPQFFSLSEHLGEANKDQTLKFEAAELAGIAEVLLSTSQPIDLLKPADGYQPDAERGQKLFVERGCLACHQHSAVPESKQDFGPNISDIHQKVTRNSGDPKFSDWLYTWIKEPERYHKRTQMPNLYLESYKDVDGTTDIDPAADITAFLLAQGEPGTFPVRAVDPVELDKLVEVYLKKGRFGVAKAQEIISTRQFPDKLADVIGDESVLATADGAPVADGAAWHKMKLAYVGRKTISRYGCYACHDMPGYEDARPIGVALQDWGRKDTSKLGFEHIKEFLHHHGEPQGSKFSSTSERIVSAHRKAAAGGLEAGQFSPEEAVSEMSAAFFYDSLERHGRPGFIWQKLRAPRSYDYEKTETKGYDERLRMPKFPLKEDEIEAIATFVLGLVAEPPAAEYVYTPDEREKTRIEGEFLLAKYNCTGCHVVELPKVTFAADLASIESTQLEAGDHPAALELLLKMRPARQGLTGETKTIKIDEEKLKLHVASFHGFVAQRPDPEETDPELREYGFDVWEPVEFGTGDEARRLLPGAKVNFPESRLISIQDARGGQFAEVLVDKLLTYRFDQRNLAWQASPPPLYQEGVKVQTSWLYEFLLEPGKIRYTTVLRMPKFNMSPAEARTLANYFAAVDGAVFPYEEQAPKDVDYIDTRSAQLTSAGHLELGQSYLEHSWDLLNGPLCIKCHSVGAKKFKVSDPAKDIQGPNLVDVQNRLRSDWVKLWLYRPSWITPYTSMPVNFPKNAAQFPDRFKGDPDAHVVGVRDALMNYGRLLEEIGPTVYQPPGQPATTPAPAAGGEEE